MTITTTAVAAATRTFFIISSLIGLRDWSRVGTVIS
jgi:hypothetical protein